MIKKIIATSDWHIRPIKRHEEFKEQFDKLVADVIKEKPERLVIAGDLFHSKITVSNEMYEVVGEVLNALAEHTKIIIIPGNHDAIINSNRLDSISPIIKMINNDNIVYYKKSGVFPDKWGGDIAWCVWSCLEHQASPDIKEFKTSTNKDYTYVGLYHGVVNGSTTDIGFSFTDEGVDTSEFFNTDFFIAGDIHKHQTYNYENYKGMGKGVMCGSFIQQDFGENPENHGYVILSKSFKDWDIEIVEVESDYGYFTFNISSVDDIENI